MQILRWLVFLLIVPFTFVVTLAAAAVHLVVYLFGNMILALLTVLDMAYGWIVSRLQGV